MHPRRQQPTPRGRGQSSSLDELLNTMLRHANTIENSVLEIQRVFCCGPFSTGTVWGREDEYEETQAALDGIQRLRDTIGMRSSFHISSETFLHIMWQEFDDARQHAVTANRYREWPILPESRRPPLDSHEESVWLALASQQLQVLEARLQQCISLHILIQGEQYDHPKLAAIFKPQPDRGCSSPESRDDQERRNHARLIEYHFAIKDIDGRERVIAKVRSTMRVVQEAVEQRRRRLLLDIEEYQAIPQPPPIEGEGTTPERQLSQRSMNQGLVNRRMTEQPSQHGRQHLPQGFALPSWPRGGYYAPQGFAPPSPLHYLPHQAPLMLLAAPSSRLEQSLVLGPLPPARAPMRPVGNSWWQDRRAPQELEYRGQGPLGPRHPRVPAPAPAPPPVGEARLSPYQHRHRGQ